MFMCVMGGTGEERGIYIPCMVHFLSLHRKLRMAKGRRGREGRGGKERGGEYISRFIFSHCMGMG